MTTNYRGIDYSGIGATCNRDSATGIRYGILSANSEHITEWLWESVETVYLPYCPHCYEQLAESWDDEETQKTACNEAIDDEVLSESEIDDLCDSICPHCYSPIEDGEQYPDCADPDGNILQGDEEGFVDDSNDIWVTDSPYFTYAQYCSPCAPGACHLENPLNIHPNQLGEYSSNRAYCLGHDWFKGNTAPYPVYDVKTGQIVPPPAK